MMLWDIRFMRELEFLWTASANSFNCSVVLDRYKAMICFRITGSLSANSMKRSRFKELPA
jgi:hypothetical protein